MVKRGNLACLYFDWYIGAHFFGGLFHNLCTSARMRPGLAVRVVCDPCTRARRDKSLLSSWVQGWTAHRLTSNKNRRLLHGFLLKKRNASLLLSSTGSSQGWTVRTESCATAEWRVSYIWHHLAGQGTDLSQVFIRVYGNRSSITTSASASTSVTRLNLKRPQLCIYEYLWHLTMAHGR